MYKSSHIFRVGFLKNFVKSSSQSKRSILDFHVHTKLYVQVTILQNKSRFYTFDDFLLDFFNERFFVQLPSGNFSFNLKNCTNFSIRLRFIYFRILILKIVYRLNFSIIWWLNIIFIGTIIFIEPSWHLYPYSKI